MQVDVTTVGSYQKNLSFTVPAVDVQRELDLGFRNLAKEVRLKGFRPGKAPRHVLEAMFGARVRSDVAQRLIQSNYEKAAAEAGLAPLSAPRVENRGPLADNAPFTFTVVVEVKPEVTFEDYRGLKVAYPRVEVTEDEVEQALQRQLAGLARWVEVTDRPVQAGDKVLVTMKLFSGDELVLDVPGALVNTSGDAWYGGLEDALVGRSLQESASAEVTFRAEAKTSEIAGKTLRCDFTVASIQSLTQPQLDEATSTELGFEGGPEAARAATRMRLQETRAELARNQARANVLDALILAHPFDVPPGMVESAYQMLADELKMQLAMQQGRDPKSIHFGSAQVADLRNRSSFLAKASILLEHVAGREGLTIEQDDIERKYEELAMMRGQTVEAVRGWFAQNDEAENLRARLLEEKTLDWLLEQAELVEPESDAGLLQPQSDLQKMAASIIDEQVRQRLAHQQQAAKASAEADAEPAADDSSAAEPPAEG